MRGRWGGLAAVVVTLAVGADATAQAPKAPVWSPQVWLHAHNCYPDDGHGADRLARALASARGTVAIEQDVVWDAARRQSVVSHDTELDGREPALEEHFFAAVSARLDRALEARATATWPLIVLHLDFKTNEPEHHAAIWSLLGRYERWLTTAPRVDAAGGVQALTLGPLLVLTEQGEGQEKAFHDAVAPGARLRIFGTVPTPAPPEGLSVEARAALAAATAPEVLVPSGATNYRRWTNHAWGVVEEGGPPRAGAWTPADEARLAALVRRARALGLWLRFYTLNGHPKGHEGWTEGYNFGTLAAVTTRWEAAIAAGVDFIATDQYEAFSETRARVVR